MSEAVVKVENLCKQYRIGTRKDRYKTLADALGNFIKAPFENYRKLRSLKRFKEEENTDTIWALKDINFEINAGEAVGIIGRNGAGKSTLLKVISRITQPSKGRIIINGRVSSLLEVGTGFNPELTGHENIYLNGTILGMTRREINKKRDEIIEFSGVEKFIYTPVKRYSSGMYVRLAFAVAAHLDPEILIIDEVLAVGDAEFQKKCLGKMKDVSGQGRTVLFVSHNMQAVKNLCTKSIVLQSGSVAFIGETQDAVDFYLEGLGSGKINFVVANFGNDDVLINYVKVYGPDDDKLYTDSAIFIDIDFNLLIEDDAIFHATLHFYDELNNCIFYLTTGDSDTDEKTGMGNYRIKFTIPANILYEGVYRIGSFLIVRNRAHAVYKANDILSFRVIQKAQSQFGWTGKIGILRPKFLNTKVYTIKTK